MSVDSSNKYDLGYSESPYFKDKNKDCKETIHEQYCDCNGEPFCIMREEYLPYVQKHEILAPVFISTTWGSEKYYKAKIEVDAFKKRSKTYIHIDKPLQVGDILQVKGDCCAKYFIKSKLKKRDKFNNFIVEIVRLDGYNMVHLDLNKFEKSVTVMVRGYFKEHKCFQ